MLLSRQCVQLAFAWQALDANGAPAPIATSEREGGQVVAQVGAKI